MPEKNVAQLSIMEVYTVLKQNYPDYKSKYPTLNKETKIGELKQLIRKELESHNIDSEFKGNANTLPIQINEVSTVISVSIKEQFDEFITLNELLSRGYSQSGYLDAYWQIETLCNFSLLTKSKSDFFLANLNRCLQSATKEDRQLKTIAEILINHYFPALLNANCNQQINRFLDKNGLNKLIKEKDIPALENSLRIYQAKIRVQKATITPTDISDSDDEIYYSCDEWNETENANRLDDSESDSYYSCADEDEFFDALEDCTSGSSPSIVPLCVGADEKPSHHSLQRLMQRLINWLQNLMYRLHILHRTEENPSRTTLSTVQEIDPVDISDTVSITSRIELEKPTNSPVSPSIETWEKQERTFELLSKSTGNLCNFYPEKNNETIVDNAPQTKNVVCLLRSLSTMSVSF